MLTQNHYWSTSTNFSATNLKTKQSHKSAEQLHRKQISTNELISGKAGGSLDCSDRTQVQFVFLWGMLRQRVKSGPWIWIRNWLNGCIQWEESNGSVIRWRWVMSGVFITGTDSEIKWTLKFSDDLSSLETFKVWLNGLLSDPIELKM